MSRKNIPFEFVFDHLPLSVTVKPMFGLWAVYVDEKIVMVLRQRNDQIETNGIWVATTPEHHKSLKKELPSLQPFSIYSKAVTYTEWQLLPENDDDFEVSVIKVCQLIKKADHRIGKIPIPGKKKNP